MTPMRTMPNRPLCPQPGQKAIKYTNKDNTDIRKTFAKWRRLQALQFKKDDKP